MSRKNTPADFWNRVNVCGPDECWEWSGATNSGGYGTISWSGAVVVTHRVAYMLARGNIRLETGFRHEGKAKRYKRFVLHTCDNRRCCNPAHLFLGSMRTNLLDAYAKKRKMQPRSAHVNAKLTPTQVQDIRHRYDAGVSTQVQLAAEFLVSQRTISLAVRRETYTDVKETAHGLNHG
jgi:hypothetical protein